MQVYQAVLIALLVVQDIRKTNQTEPDAEDQEDVEVIDMMEKDNAELQRMITSTDLTKTAYTLIHGQHRDLVEKKTTDQYFPSEAEATRFRLYETMNSRMVDLQCTYAQYAQKHLTLLYSVADHYLLHENVAKVVLELQSLYVDVMRMAMATLLNKNYEPSKWMYDLLKFLHMETIDPTTYKAQLAGMLTKTMEITHAHSCNLNCLPKTFPEELMTEKTFYFLYNSLFDMKKPLASANPEKTWLVGNGIRTEFVEQYSYEKQNYKPDEDPQKKYVNIPIVVRVCDKYLFRYFMNLKTNIAKNVLDILYLINENRRGFPFSNYKSIDLQEQKMLESFPLAKYNDETVNSDSDWYVEFVETDSLRGKVSELLNNGIWRSEKTNGLLQNIRNKQEPVKEGTEKIDYKHYYRSELSKLTKLNNSLMYDLQCTYAFYAQEHLKGVATVLNDKKGSTKSACHKDDLDLIADYFDVSLKSLATIYYANYQAPEWMLLLVVYLNNVRRFCKDMNNFKIENQKMMKIINDITTSCEITDSPPIVLKLPKEEIQLTYTNQPIYKFKSLQLHTKDMRLTYVTTMCDNITRALYFMHINENVLQDKHYKSFHPNKWLFSSTAMTKNRVNNLRWDVNKRFGKDAQWKAASGEITSNLNAGVEFTDSFRNAVLIHKRIIGFISAALMRYVLLLAGFCSSITYSYNYFNEFVLSYSQPTFYDDYTSYCIEFQDSIVQLLEWSGLKTNKVFMELLDALAVLKTNGDIFQTKGFRLAVKKLNQYSVNMGIDAHVSLIYYWVLYTSKIHQSISINKSILNVLLTMVKDINSDITNYGNNLKRDYKGFNLNSFLLVSKSFGNNNTYMRNTFKT